MLLYYLCNILQQKYTLFLIFLLIAKTGAAVSEQTHAFTLKPTKIQSISFLYRRLQNHRNCHSSLCLVWLFPTNRLWYL